MNATRSPQEIGLLWFDQVWNHRNHAMAQELMAPDAVAYLEGGVEIKGRDAFLAFQAEFLQAMPDIRIDVKNSLSDDNGVCLHWNAKGTHTGPGLGLVPSGEPLSFQGVTWLETADGRIVGGRDFWNREGLMQTMAAACAKAAK